MGTSRSALDRLLDPTNASVTLYTMTTAARALGPQLDLRLSRLGDRRAVREHAKRTPAATAVRERRT